MKSTIKTGLAAILLLLAFSCTKESTNSSASTANRSAQATASQSSDALAESLDAPDALTVVGDWILYYDWDCTGYFYSSVMNIYADGTWSNDQGYTGIWVSGRHMLSFTFNDSETTYSGVIFSEKIKGIMSTFQYAGSLQGCFNMVPLTDKNFRPDRKAGAPDASGKTVQ